VDIGVFLDPATAFVSAEFRQVEVHDDQFGVFGDGHRQNLMTVSGEQQLDTAAPKEGFFQFQKYLDVVCQ
jgi:hypothetical protein